MNWKLAVALGVGVAGIVVVGASVRGAGTREVGEQRFAVPEEWLFDTRIPWLPAPEADSFTFHLDPTKNPNEIPAHLVLVEAADEVCRGPRKSQIMEVACGRERTSVPVGPPYQKAFPIPDYPDAWDYYEVGKPASDGQSKKLQVAWCTPISPNPARPKGTAICTSVWGVSGLVLSLGFEENELPQLAEMRARATQMLLSWRVR